jgi:DNA-binding NarL/FixJ family response regulator
MGNSNFHSTPLYAPSRDTGPLKGKYIRLLIAGHQSVYREELRRICEAENDIKVLEEAEDGLKMINLVRELKPDVVLMDIQMTVIDDDQIIRQILTIYPKTAVILLCLDHDINVLVKAFQAGARAHLSKDVQPSEIVETIRAVYHGETYVDSQVTARILEMLRRKKNSKKINDRSLTRLQSR